MSFSRANEACRPAQKQMAKGQRRDSQASQRAYTYTHAWLPGHMHAHIHRRRRKKKYTEKVTPSPSNITMPSPGVKAPSEGLVHPSGQKKNQD